MFVASFEAVIDFFQGEKKMLTRTKAQAQAGASGFRILEAEP